MKSLPLRAGRCLSAVLLSATLLAPVGAVAQAQFSALSMAIAEGVAGQDGMASFYRARDFAPIWTTTEAAERRNALLTALEGAANHGLPVDRYDPEELRAAFREADNPYEAGRAEVLATRMFLQYARDVQSGILEPSELASDVFKELPRRDPEELLAALIEGNPHDFMRSLPPAHPEYTRLMRERMRLGQVVEAGGWGPQVPSGTLEPGDSGPAVVALRNRLIAMGYLPRRTASAVYDAALTDAVMEFQAAHGLTPDGVAGASTIEQVNVPARDRLEQVILHMERQRWLNLDRGERHILVNIPDFHAFVIDNEVVTFETRVVVGHRASDRHTPEFSDMMEHMVINPSWYVPRSIAVNEYFPAMIENPEAHGHLQLIRGGSPVSRANIDLTGLTPREVPFDLRQPPGPGNALGRVKFMFPNRHNIYLHDTPARNLFSREVRAYSHGCIRVHRPLELAYHLLEPQAGDGAQSLFDGILRTGNETTVPLETHIPVHLVYWTAWVEPDGRANYRRDIYGRNAILWRAMEAAGVTVEGSTS